MYCITSATVMILSSATATMPFAKRALSSLASCPLFGAGGDPVTDCATAVTPLTATNVNDRKQWRSVMGSAGYSETRQFHVNVEGASGRSTLETGCQSAPNRRGGHCCA